MSSISCATAVDSDVMVPWDLTESQSTSLLGVSPSRFRVQGFSRDTLLRIALLNGIYSDLCSEFGEDVAGQWVSRTNPLKPFFGAKPLDYMIKNGLPGIFRVRQLTDSWTPDASSVEKSESMVSVA